MARSRARKAQRSRILNTSYHDRKAQRRAYRVRYGIEHSNARKVRRQGASKRDALDYAVSGGHFESNRRKH